MSETPYGSDDSDPTQRIEPGASTPGPTPAQDPTTPLPTTPLPTTPLPTTPLPAGPPSAPDLTKRPPAGPSGPDFSTPPAHSAPPANPQSGPPAGYYPPPASTPAHLAYGPAAGQPGYAQPGYPAYPGYPGYPQQGYGTPQYDPYGRPLSDKNKVVAGVLGIALGGFGAGRFYTGHTGIAVAQLVVTLVTCGLGHFWGLIDGIMILVNGGTDAEGRILRD
jgi:TM2 domain-containing membrane protein YozV